MPSDRQKDSSGTIVQSSSCLPSNDNNEHLQSTNHFKFLIRLKVRFTDLVFLNMLN
jgi:hypothetical protein